MLLIAEEKSDIAMNAPSITSTPFINTNLMLEAYCEKIKSKKVIALDTEFLRVNTFHSIPGLFQLNDGENIVLIDPCVITQWESFKAILTNRNIIKVFHACEEDIELFYHFLNVEPQSVFDTQIAAAFCGFDFCMGYQRLIQAMLNVELEKTSSRSDWMQRPLTEKQIHYAVDDVRYLLPVFDHLHKVLDGRGLLYIMEEEYQSILQNFTSTHFENAYQRIKEAWRLNSKQFAVLKSLATWREKSMREKNLPRKRIASDEALLSLAMRENWNIHQLFEIEGLPAATVKNYGQILLELMNSILAKTVFHEVAPKPIRSDSLLNNLKSIMQKQAKEFGVDEKMLSKKSYNEFLYFSIVNGSYVVPESIIGWRRPFYEKAALLLQNNIGTN